MSNIERLPRWRIEHERFTHLEIMVIRDQLPGLMFVLKQIGNVRRTY